MTTPTYDAEKTRAALEEIVKSGRRDAAETAGQRDTDVQDDAQRKTADREGERIQADREDALVDAALARVAEAEAALQRLDDGTYGLCVVCGKPIEAARLEARPESGRCLADQEKAEAEGEIRMTEGTVQTSA